MVNWRINHRRTDMNTEPRNCENPKPISRDTQWNHRERQRHLLPRRPEEKVPRQQARNKQHQRRMNPAALLGDLNYNAGQMEVQSLPVNRRARQIQERRCSIRRGVLEEFFEPIREPIVIER